VGGVGVDAPALSLADEDPSMYALTELLTVPVTDGATTTFPET
jgi:hypothetical protein